jgi:hypothetical protein
MISRKKNKVSGRVWKDEEVKAFKNLYDEYKRVYGKTPNVVALNIIGISIDRVVKGEECYWDETYPGKLVWGTR